MVRKGQPGGAQSRSGRNGRASRIHGEHYTMNRDGLGRALEPRSQSLLLCGEPFEEHALPVAPGG